MLKARLYAFITGMILPISLLPLPATADPLRVAQGQMLDCAGDMSGLELSHVRSQFRQRAAALDLKLQAQTQIALDQIHFRLTPALRRALTGKNPRIFRAAIKGDRYGQNLLRRGGLAARAKFGANPAEPFSRRLSNQMAFLALVRDFDPTLSPGTREAIVESFRLLAARNFVVSHLAPVMVQHPESAELAMPLSLEGIRSAYAELLGEQRRRYAGYFPEAKFEDLRALVADASSGLDVMRISESSLFAGLGSPRATYEEFLLNLYGGDHREATARRIHALRSWFELAEVVGNDASFLGYVESVLHALRLPPPA